MTSACRSRGSTPAVSDRDVNAIRVSLSGNPSAKLLLIRRTGRGIDCFIPKCTVIVGYCGLCNRINTRKKAPPSSWRAVVFYSGSISYFSHRYRTALGESSCCLGAIPIASNSWVSVFNHLRKVSEETPAAIASSYLYFALYAMGMI